MKRSKALALSLATTFVIGLTLFGSAGRFGIPAFWAYMAVNAAISLTAIFMLDPALIDERIRPGGQALPIRMWLVWLLLLVHWCAAGLDRGRLHWTDTVPFSIQITSFVLFAVASAAALWAMQVNQFFSSVVRLQPERGQLVVTTGPYRLIRHPGYAAGIVFALSSGPALGSWLAAITAAPAIPLLLWRTISEDRFLQDELPGYLAYAERVRYRLVPGLW
ncbi:MAG: isoprenylcysteine carboxylmethyltransferase family protein [Acetobacteraceae bacterium]|nr:isoprenylcysteine carboxylmethyltransferase family protein [Acetobacteraceae bacterium]